MGLVLLLETYSDASVSANGVAAGAWVTYEAEDVTCTYGPCLSGSEYLGAEAETREAECRALVRGMKADLELLEYTDYEEVVMHTDNICVAKALETGIIYYAPLHSIVAEARAVASLIEGYGASIRYVWTPRWEPRLQLAHALAWDLQRSL